MKNKNMNEQIQAYIFKPTFSIADIATMDAITIRGMKDTFRNYEKSLGLIPKRQKKRKL